MNVANLNIKDQIDVFFEGRHMYFNGGSSDAGTEITATFDPRFSEHMWQQRQKYWKNVDVLLRYGYRGLSRGGSNGVMKITKRDKNIFASFLRDFSSGKLHDLLAENFDGNITDISGLKIVSHRGALRVVGAMDLPTRRAVFYGERPY